MVLILSVSTFNLTVPGFFVRTSIETVPVEDRADELLAMVSRRTLDLPDAPIRAVSFFDSVTVVFPSPRAITGARNLRAESFGERLLC
jgi:hypothetical protein